MTTATHYQQNLAGAPVALHDGHPMPGYYKMRLGSKTGPWVPVAIWEKDGVMVAVRGDGKGGRTRVDPNDIWTYVAGNPVKQADAKYAFEHGRWEGDAPTIGDNSREYPATYEGIQAEFADYAELVQQFLADIAKAGGIKEKVNADKASNMADAIGTVKGGIAKRADEMREALVRPHLDAQREINGQFKPIIEEAKTLDAQLRRAAGAWAKAEQDRLQKIADENARKAREAAEAEAKRQQEAHDAAALAALKDLKEGTNPVEVVASFLETPAPAPVPEIVAEKVKVQVGGQRGAVRSLKTKLVAQIENYDLALAHFKDSDLIREVVLKLAQRAVDAKLGTPPGVKVVEENKL